MLFFYLFNFQHSIISSPSLVCCFKESFQALNSFSSIRERDATAKESKKVSKRDSPSSPGVGYGGSGHAMECGVG